jgi:hypothetical protein
MKWWKWLLVAFGAFVLWALLRTPSPEEQARMSARRAIETCWQDQQRKSLPPEQARFIAGACEGMEKEFRARFNASP